MAQGCPTPRTIREGAALLASFAAANRRPDRSGAEEAPPHAFDMSRTAWKRLERPTTGFTRRPAG
ncbi:hypothetical protein [Streptomyces sp. NBC_01579]|uniref:hypothetical protein n=1 Tax=Streptomyces sp. NBC_01579 TaxID=2975885 RepID=UPI0038647316